MATVDFENIVLNIETGGVVAVSVTAYDTIAIEEYKELSLSAAISAAVTGTATASITEADIVTGGKTIIITLTGDTWIAN